MADYVYPLRITTSGLAPSAHTIGYEVMCLIATGTTQAAARTAIQSGSVAITAPINAGGTSVWLTLTSSTVYVGYAAYTFFSTFQTGVTSSPLDTANVNSITVPVSLRGNNQRERYVKKQHYDFIVDEYNDPSIMSTINERNFTGKYIRKDYVGSPFATYSSDPSNRYVPSKMLFWTVNAKSGEVTYEEPETQMKNILWTCNVIHYGGHGPFSYRFDIASGGYSFDTIVDGSSGYSGTTTQNTTISIPQSMSPSSLEGSYSPTVQGAGYVESSTSNSKTCTVHIPGDDFTFDIIVRAISPNESNPTRYYPFQFDLSSLTIVDQIGITGITCSGVTDGVYRVIDGHETGPLYQNVHIRAGQWLRFIDDNIDDYVNIRFITEDGYNYKEHADETHFVQNGRMYTMQVSDPAYLSAKTLYVDYVLDGTSFTVSADTTTVYWDNGTNYDITIPLTTPNSYITAFDAALDGTPMYRISSTMVTLAANSRGTITASKLVSSKTNVNYVGGSITASRSGGAIRAMVILNNSIQLAANMPSGQVSASLSTYELSSNLTINRIDLAFASIG